MSFRPAIPVIALSLLVPLLGACGDAEPAASAGLHVSVEAGDDDCLLNRGNLDAGTTTFAVTNTGTKVTEVYVYAREGEDFDTVVSEVENIGPGTSRDMVVDLPSGEYEVACKPGQTGDGIRAALTVSGEEGGTTSAEVQAAFDREIELATDGATITGLSGAAGKATLDERIEVKLANDAVGPRILELKDPTGAVVGEVQGIEPGSTGELVVTFDQTGTWQVIVEGAEVDDIAVDFKVTD